MTRVLPWAGTEERTAGVVDTPAVSPAIGAPAIAFPQRRLGQRQWTRRYVLQLLITDALCATVAVAVGWWVRFGFDTSASTDSYLFLSVVLTAGWLLSLQGAGAYEIRRISTGSGEYQRVLRAGLNLAGSVAILAYLTQMLLARTFVAIVIPFGMAMMLVARYAGRQTVHARRKRGGWTSTILAVGTSESVAHLAYVTRRGHQAGLVVIGACVEDAAPGDEIAPGVPVVGDVAHAADLAAQLGADIVAVAGSGLGPRRIRELGWALEGTGCNMVMAPGLTEVAGPRVHVSPVEGLPLMWVDQPQFTGLGRVVKRALDVTVSGALLLFLLPFFLLIGLVVRLTSRGPALYRSTRMGVHGREFRVYKFRSMYVDADKRRDDLLALNEIAGGTLFKMRRDPRVTPVGRLLRKFSIDELPQLANVLTGSMSLVGPRPPLPDEVEKYHRHVHRRLLVKPGMTGLWQVSGRSDLDWDESVRLDLYYVENWSLTFDLAIIARTVWAVLRSRGAY